MDSIKQLAEIVAAARNGIAFTGAGMSTESGIADFRSPGGLWSRHQPVMYDEFLASRPARVRYWKMREELYAECRNARPNDGHRALVELERRALIKAVITQNIDGLHQDAGSKVVLELHGTNRIIACVECGREWHPDEILLRLRAGDDAPGCDDCGNPLKSKTISFGQAMPAAIMHEASRLAARSDVFLAIGSSLVVEPAASLPRLAKHRGSKLVIVNRTETPLDYLADLIIRESIGATLHALLQELPPDDF